VVRRSRWSEDVDELRRREHDGGVEADRQLLLRRRSVRLHWQRSTVCTRLHRRSTVRGDALLARGL